MSLTSELPLRHPAVLISLFIIGLGLSTIAFERHLGEIGALRPTGIKLLLSCVGLLVWVWLMLHMIGRPEEFTSSGRSVLDLDNDQKRVNVVRRVGYALQIFTVTGLLAIAVSHANRVA